MVDKVATIDPGNIFSSIELDVNSDNNRFYATATLTVDQRYVKTPDDLLIVRSAQIVDSSGVGAGTERDFLDYRDTNFMAEYNKSDATGVPKYYKNAEI